MPPRHTDSLFVSRTILQLDHRQLRDNMDMFNRQMPDITLQWRHLGQVGVMLVQAGEYRDLIQQPRSRLATRPPQQVAKH